MCVCVVLTSKPRRSVLCACTTHLWRQSRQAVGQESPRWLSSPHRLLPPLRLGASRDDMMPWAVQAIVHTTHDGRGWEISKRRTTKTTSCCPSDPSVRTAATTRAHLTQCSPPPSPNSSGRRRGVEYTSTSNCQQHC